MNEKTFKKLEYDKIIAKLSGYVSFACGRELANALLPADSIAEVEKRLEETDEAATILRLYPTFTLGGVRDIREALHHVEIGGILDIEALINIADTCRAARMTRTFFNEIKGSYPHVGGLGKNLTIIKSIESAVEKTVAPDGSIADTASDKLYQLRKKKKVINERVKERLDGLIKNPNTQKYLQEAIVTIRDNRYVVPVRQEYRAQVPGIVHDISSSGASVFIEPMFVMELNNELQKLAREEEEEIQAILRALTMMVSSFRSELQDNLRRLSRLDFIFAKARYSYEINGVSPKINGKGQINLLSARHPLIAASQVVPINVKITKDLSAMVITGPNTGGKTVTLKTIGLLTLMGLAGLHIPAEIGSEICFFEKVFADIGDEQSIEQSLSTFSSHMVNIVDILEQVDDTSLILLDELGAGTDPTEGAALAMAILDYLKRMGAKIVATTHYSELKAFAYNNPGFINASVEFDVVSLQPTYRLMMGVPGKSNAFEIARRLGMTDAIIEEASGFLTTEDAQVADLLANLEDLRQKTAEENEAAARLKEEIKRRENELEREAQKIRIEAAEELRKANKKSREIVEDTKARSEKLYQEMKQKMEEEKAAEKTWQESKRKLKSWEDELREKEPERIYEGKAPESVQAGDRVYIPRLKQHGFVLNKPDKNKEVPLQVGILKMSLKLEELRPANEDDKEKELLKKRGGGIQREKVERIQNEVHLRGLESVEAIEILDKYLDDAFVAGLKTVRIVHGKGTGVLRKEVANYLSKHRLVKSFRMGDYYEGGMGVTIAELNL